MGVILQGKCPACGYVIDASTGSGMQGISLEPRVCLDCREIVSVPVGDMFNRLGPDRKLRHCPMCGGTNFQPFSYSSRESSKQVSAGSC
jgi:rubredoxin